MPVLAGPYTSEVGHEITVWIPYLRAMLGDEFKDAVVISRGANDAWYPCKVLNAYDVVPVDEFREHIFERLKTRNTSKPLFGDKLDALILERFGLPAPNYHPLNIFSGSTKRWGEWYPYGGKFAPVERIPGLPDKYVVARFYRNQWLLNPPTIEEDLPIVRLHLTDQPDNHVGLDFPSDLMVNYEAHSSFGVLTSVISHAEKLYCNYGSIPHLGISCGTPVEAYTHYLDDAHRCWHAKLEQKLARKCGASLKINYVERVNNKRWGRLEQSPAPMPS